MVRHFRDNLEKFLLSTYRSGATVEDPYELVKAFCVEDGTRACEKTKIPSLKRKKQEAARSAEKRPEL